MPPGTYREGDGSAVAFSDAKAAWASAARQILARVARRYHDYITYADLAEEVQQVSGIRTRSLIYYWIGGVLEAIALDRHRRREPLLSALCVHSDGTVGDGYGNAIADTYGFVPDDLDVHAAQERLACYRRFAADLPADGGHAALTPQVKARRARARRQATRERAHALCPNCFLELPRTGQCDNCS